MGLLGSLNPTALGSNPNNDGKGLAFGKWTMATKQGAEFEPVSSFRRHFNLPI